MTAENGFAAIPLQHAIDRLDGMRLSEHSLESALQQVATLAKQAVPGASEVSVTLLTKDRADTVVSTGQLATDVDESQYERGYGPCLDAARSGETQVIEDAASESRWGDYTRAAVQYGVLSSVSAPINLQQTPTVSAALNLYSTRAHAFDPASVQSAVTLASYAEHTLVNFHHQHGAHELVRRLELSVGDSQHCNHYGFACAWPTPAGLHR